MKKFISLFMLTTIILSGCGVVDSVEIISDGNFASEISTTTTSDSANDDDIQQTESATSYSTTTTSSHTEQTTEKSIFVVTAETSTKTQAVYTIPPIETAIQTTTAPVAVQMSSKVQNHLAEMSLHEKICQMFIVIPEAVSGYDVFTYVDCNFHKGYSDYPVGGFIFFAKNIISSEQTAIMITDMQNDALYMGTGAFMAVDEEGGTVTRVQSQLGEQAVYDMNYYGGLNDWNTAYSVGEIIGSYLSGYGFNLDFAPVADVNISPYNELGSRIFSTDPQIVADMSGAVVDGLQSQGICSTLKHFPGLGAGNSNTHYNSVWIDRTHEQLQQTEFPAFKGGIDAGSDFVMVGHQITSASGDNLPGNLSKVVVTDWLKNELGFKGLVVTDSHSMGAITNVYTSGEASVLAIEAGVDMVLMPSSLADAVAGVEQAVQSGRISEERINESVVKILSKKNELGLI
ncbi:MAG: glycoside hydrolase family 3 protein [Ruminococcus sp.]|nr:glycoside hydrolase family 3 protein [Ruminococcus sp.]